MSTRDANAEVTQSEKETIAKLAEASMKIQQLTILVFKRLTLERLVESQFANDAQKKTFKKYAKLQDQNIARQKEFLSDKNVIPGEIMAMLPPINEQMAIELSMVAEKESVVGQLTDIALDLRVSAWAREKLSHDANMNPSIEDFVIPAMLADDTLPTDLREALHGYNITKMQFDRRRLMQVAQEKATLEPTKVVLGRAVCKLFSAESEMINSIIANDSGISTEFRHNLNNIFNELSKEHDSHHLGHDDGQPEPSIARKIIDAEPEARVKLLDELVSAIEAVAILKRLDEDEPQRSRPMSINPSDLRKLAPRSDLTYIN